MSLTNRQKAHLAFCSAVHPANKDSIRIIQIAFMLLHNLPVRVFQYPALGIIAARQEQEQSYQSILYVLHKPRRQVSPSAGM